MKEEIEKIVNKESNRVLTINSLHALFVQSQIDMLEEIKGYEKQDGVIQTKYIDNAIYNLKQLL